MLKSHWARYANCISQVTISIDWATLVVLWDWYTKKFTQPNLLISPPLPNPILFCDSSWSWFGTVVWVPYLRWLIHLQAMGEQSPFQWKIACDWATGINSTELLKWLCNSFSAFRLTGRFALRIDIIKERKVTIEKRRLALQSRRASKACCNKVHWRSEEAEQISQFCRQTC